MTTTQATLTDVVHELLKDAGEPYTARTLIDAMRDKTGVSEQAALDAIWQLLDSQRIELTLDRRLRLSEGRDAA